METHELYILIYTVIILCMCPANERRRYNVTLSPIGWAHTQYDPCLYIAPMRLLQYRISIQTHLKLKSIKISFSITHSSLSLSNILKYCPARQWYCHARCKIVKQFDNWYQCYGGQRFHKIWPSMNFEGLSYIETDPHASISHCNNSCVIYVGIILHKID